MAEASDDRGTLAAIGVLTVCLSAFGHEAFGHGGACLLAGGSITLLTATHFACAGGTIWVDAAGPLINLMLAAAAFLLLRIKATAPPSLQWFLFLLGGINLCWFASEMVASPVVDNYDEAAIARQLGLGGLWRPACFAIGILLYAWTVGYARKVLRRDFPIGMALRRRFGISHLAGTLAFVLAGLCWVRAPFGAAFECFLTIGVAVAPLWLSLTPATRSPASGGAISRSRGWIALAALCYVTFLLVQARGIARLA